MSLIKTKNAAEFVHYLRVREGIPQTQFATIIGVHSSHISLIESKKRNVSPMFKNKLIEAYSLTLTQNEVSHFINLVNNTYSNTISLYSLTIVEKEFMMLVHKSILNNTLTKTDMTIISKAIEIKELEK